MTLAGWIQGQAGLPLLPLLTLSAIALEWALGQWRRRPVYDLRETAVTVFIALGHRLVNLALAGSFAAPALWAYRHRLLDIPLQGAIPLTALFFAVELAYYLQHLSLHKLRWFWASHCVHHSASRINLSAGLRLGWASGLAGGFLFYLPLILLGFSPTGVLGMLALNGLYQFFLHMAHAPSLGPLEWVLNTPRHHHVHHAVNDSCLDRNFGGILIVFDRLFGTFAAAPADEALKFGLSDPSARRAGIAIIYAGWLEVGRAVAGARGPVSLARALFGRPGLPAAPPLPA
jgi:sterol desaturase/sphingolipid hydroxylase (fatty acid hydroxylase superfamily)